MPAIANCAPPIPICDHGCGDRCHSCYSYLEYGRNPRYHPV